MATPATSLPAGGDPREGRLLSAAQSRMWFTAQYAPDSPAYNQTYALRLSGEVDEQALLGAVRDLVTAHPVLRSLVDEGGGEPRSVPGPVDGVPVAVVGRLPRAELRAALEAEAQRPFDLRTQPPLRVTLHRAGDALSLLVLTFHHIAMDAWSFRLLEGELAARYRARLGAGPPPPEPAVAYADFVAWEAEQDTSAGVEWWAGRLGGLESMLPLPHDRPRGHRAEGAGGSVPLSFPAPLATGIRQLAASARATPFTVLLAGWQALLARLSGTEDIAVGVPVAGRDDPAFEQTLGSFVNTVVVRADLGGRPSGRELVGRVREALLQALDHSEVPFEQVVRRLRPERSPGSMPLIQVMVNHTRGREPVAWTAGLTAETEEILNGTAKFDLTLHLTEDRRTLGGRLAHRSDLFDTKTVERWRDWYLALLEGMTRSPGSPVTHLPLGPARTPAVAGPRDTVATGLLHRDIDRWTRQAPGATAVVGPDRRLTYAELGDAAGRVARRLRAAGVVPDQPVAVLCDRRTDLVAGLLGVLRSGGCYLPLDDTVPADRLGAVLDLAGARVVLTTRELAPRLPRDGRQVLYLDDVPAWPAATDPDPDPGTVPASLAYAVLTSGSTGRPKAVGVEHRNITHYLNALLPALEAATPGVRSFALVSTHTADLGLTAVLGALTTGRTLHLMDDDAGADPERYARYLREHAVDAIKMVPSQLEMLAAETDIGTLLPRRLLILGGEACPWDLVRRIRRVAPDLAVQTSYGPTETTVSVLTCETDRIAEADRHGVVPLGRPLAGVVCHVTDQEGRPVPDGLPGELWVGGPMVSRGYLGDREHTARAFLAGPDGTRCYRTGDLVRVRPDGVTEFLGRVDDQVKIRGRRVEPGEVAAALRTLAEVAAVHVLPVGTRHDRRLCAWVVPAAGAQPTAAGLRGQLRRKLPHYMLPAHCVVMKRLPLTPNGKVDRRALPVPDTPQRPTGARAPRTVREEILCGLLADVLNVPEVGPDDDFFALGGHSLLAARLAARVRATLGLEMTVRTVFDAPTAAELAPVLTGERGRPPLVPGPRPERVPLSGGQRALWFLHQMEGSRTGYNQCYPWRITGRLDIAALESAVADVLTRHEILRTVFPAHEGAPCQRVLDAAECAPRLRAEAWPAERLAERLDLCARHAFDLSSGIPVRVDLLALSPEEHVLVWTVHHIAGDGWSAGPLWRDLAGAYRSRRAGRGPDWQPLPVQYADFALWQEELLGAEEEPASRRSLQLDYWTKQLAGLPQRLELPWDRRPPAEAGFVGDVVPFHLDGRLHRDLTALARGHDATLFMVLQAAVAALLTRLGAGTDIPIGAPVAGRPEASLHDLVGFFVNTLVLRTDTSGDPSFRELLARVRETDLTAYDHQDLPFEDVVDRLNPARSLSHNPLFQVLLAVQNNERATFDLPGLRVAAERLDHKVAKFDLSVQFREQGEAGELLGEVEFGTDLFDRDTVLALTRRLERLLRAVVADPGVRIGDVELLDAREREDILRRSSGVGSGGNGTDPAEAVLSVPDLFRARAARTPGAVAVTDGAESLAYAELDARSDALATVLIEHGVRPEDRVAVACEGSAGAVVAAMAVLKAGGAYVPLAPADAAPGRARRAAGTEIRLVLTDRAPAADGGDREPPVLAIGAHPPAPGGARPRIAVRPDQVACVLPAAAGRATPEVAVTHRNITGLALGDAEAPGGARRVLLHSPRTSGAALHELWAPLLSGGSVVVAPPGGTDAAALARLIGAEGITGLWLSSGLFQRIAAERPGCLAGVRDLWLGGDPVPSAVVDRVRGQCPGLTVTQWGVWADGIAGAALLRKAALGPHGRPRRGVRAYVLDGRLRPVPRGVPGELYLAGAGLVRGWCADPAGTAERFVACPFGEPGGRMYRTGALARHTRGAALEVLGPAGSQERSRGVRVRAAEVESVLARHPDVAHCAAMVREVPPGERRVVAAVVARAGAEPDGGEVARWAAERLPDHLAPAGVAVLARLPLTADGVVHRAVLPTPADADAGDGAGDRPGRPVEQAVARLFADVLQCPRVARDGDFFGLGGSSLLVMRLVARVRKEFGVRLAARDVFAGPTVAQVASVIERATAGRGHPVLRAGSRPEHLPASHAQQRLWFLNRLDGQAAVYNVPLALRLTGDLDVPALRAAVADLIARHEPLRTVLPERGGAPVQRILDPRRTAPVLDPVDTDETGLRELLDADRTYRFDLGTEPPLRANLYRLGPAEHLLSLVLHHVAVDGWSLAPLWRDLGRAYAARRLGAAPDWRPLPAQYADYALWQEELLGDGNDPHGGQEPHLTFWRETLAGLPDRLGLPAERAAAGPADPRGGHLTVRFPPTVQTGLARLARSCGATLFMALHAGVTALLNRLGSGTDIPVGTVVAGRGHEALDEAVGFFVNTLVLRADASGDPTFRELLQRVQGADRAAFAHQEVPFGLVVRELNPDRAAGANPLFRVMLSVSGPPQDPPELPGLRTAFEEIHAEGVKFDLSFDFAERRSADGGPGGIDCRLGYRSQLYDPGTAGRLGGTLLRLLEQAVAEPDRPIGQLDVLSGEERERLREWNDTEVPFPPMSLVDLVAEQAARSPGAVAVRCAGGSLTYAELDERASSLARHLAGRGSGPERYVGLLLTRGTGLVVAMLAVLKTGAAYVPVDRGLPAGRISRLLAEVRPVLVLDALPDGPPDAPGTPAADARSGRRHPGHPAYLIHTSGSTGRPKGVVVTGGNLANQMQWLRRTHPLAPGDVMLAHSPLGFDASVWEIWAPLVCGATVCLAPDEVAGRIDLLADHLREQRVTHALLVPSALAELVPFLPRDELDRLTVFSGGEALPASLAASLGRVVNLYGPTETTVLVTSWQGTADGLGTGHVPLGRPVANTRVHVLDAALRPVPVGVAGEVYIAGDQVARGYHGLPGLTAERFVADPYGPPGTRMYRSGDRARWRQDGSLEYLGRADGQVKVRGFRVEPGEIEAELTTWEDVARAVVVVREDRPGDRRLAAYLLPAARGLPAEAPALPAPEVLRSRLAAVLPGHLVPDDVVVLDRLPLMPNGKVDRGRLPAPDRAATIGRGLPRTPREELLCALLAEVLGLPRVGVNDDFFALGGHSLLAVRLIHRIRGAVGLRLTIGDLFTAPTAAGIAARIDSTADGGGPFGTLLPLRAGGGRPPLFCVHPVIGLSWSYAGLVRHLPEDIPVFGLQAGGPTGNEPLPDDLDAMAREYLDQIRAVQRTGPYRLLGWSFGGAVAHAMAVLLQEQGERVSLLALVDSFVPGDEERAREEDGRELARLHLAYGALSSLDEDRLARVSLVTANNLRLGRRHTPGLFRGDALYLSAREDAGPGGADGWRPHIDGEIQVCPLPARHFDLMRPEVLPDLARAITPRLAAD
ncbi:non-ribosomal peptide synthetase [Streptomyces johnsoniae]|uniref:Amino acid adenylation domain-containing protein n=1 Tax=Streptomyces johnsoniae TaxID=3075532 RepID=A0ABU2S6B9_9ACTN|nr:non-ribosomal peptide synthetase [Streptomyces sp. DSM 41886]MDT0444519.1 amino acid adenylation domain-containing protein [Streptomyces sp. DSM 41886]